MGNETIRINLVDAINEMSRLLEVCEDPNEQFEIRLKIRELFQRLDRIIVTVITDTGTSEFNDAIKALKALTKQAKKAKKNLEKVEATIKKATNAINKVEKLVTGVAGVLPILC